jgi:hypothetical protein
MWYIEFDATPYAKGYWCGSGMIYRDKPDKHCWRRRSQDMAEAVAKLFGKNARAVFVDE